MTAAAGAIMMSFTLAEDLVIDGVQRRAGEVVQMAVQPADVSTNQELDTYLGGYTQREFGADLLSRVALIDRESDDYRDHSLNNAFEVVETAISKQGVINEIEHKSGTRTYKVTGHGLATFIPWQSQNDASKTYDLKRDSGEMIVGKLALAREIRIMTKLTTLNSWSSNNRTTLGASYQWDTGGSKNILKDIHDRMRASAAPVTDIAINPDVAFYMLTDSVVRDTLKTMRGNAPNPEIAAMAQTEGVQTFRIPGYPPFHILPAQKLNLTTGLLEYILGDDVILVANAPGLPRDGHRINTALTFRVKGPSGTGVTTNEWIPMGRGLNRGTMLETGYYEDDVMPSNISGGLIKDVLSTL